MGYSEIEDDRYRGNKFFLTRRYVLSRKKGVWLTAEFFQIFRVRLQGRFDPVKVRIGKSVLHESCR